MPGVELAHRLDAFLLELPYPGQPSGGRHVAVVLSTERFHAATGRALVAGLVHPKGDRRYPSHVSVAPRLFTPLGGGRPLPEERVVQLDQARTVPAPARGQRVGVLDRGTWDGGACLDGYGLETALYVHFQIEGYEERPFRHGRPLRPLDVRDAAYSRGSVWRASGAEGRPLVLVSNETYNEISEFVQGLELAAEDFPGSAPINLRPGGAGGLPNPAHLLPVLRSVAKAGLRPAGHVEPSALAALDQCLLRMFRE